MESVRDSAWLSFVKENWQPSIEESSHHNSLQQVFVVIVGEARDGKRNLVRRLQGQWNRSMLKEYHRENELDLEGPMGFTFVTSVQENSMLYHSSSTVIQHSKPIGIITIENLDFCSLLFIPLQQPHTKFILLFTVDITKPYEIISTLEKYTQTVLQQLESCKQNLIEIIVVVTKCDSVDSVAEEFEQYDICFNTSALEIQAGAYVKLNRRIHFVNLIQFQLRQFCSTLQASLFYTSAHKDLYCGELKNYLFHICYQTPFTLPEIRPHSLPIILKGTDTEQLRKELKTDAVLSDAQRETFKLEQFKIHIQKINSTNNNTNYINEEEVIIKAEELQQFLKRNYTLIKTGFTLPKTLPISSLNSFANESNAMSSPRSTGSSTVNSSSNTPIAQRTELTPRGNTGVKMTSANSAEEFFLKMNSKLLERKKTNFSSTSATNSPNK